MPINDDVIRILEEVLEKARNGEVSDLAVCYICINGTASNNFSYCKNRAVSLLGALQVTQRDIMNRIVRVED